MKPFNSIKLMSSFREISNVLDTVAMIVRIFTIILVILQGILLLRDTKKNTID